MNNIEQLFKYGIIGFLAFVIDASSALILRWLFNTDSEIILSLFNVISFIVAFIFNYYVSAIFVFDDKDGVKDPSKIIITFIIALIGLVLTVALMYLFEFKLGILYIISKVIVSGIVMIWNYIARKAIIYN